MAESSHKNIQKTEKCLSSAPSHHGQLPWHDAKFYFSVLAFVQANLILSSLKKLLIVLPLIVLPFNRPE
jgi:hypothetical protein